jgi:NADH-quinone oxidoreductase subunit E
VLEPEIKERLTEHLDDYPRKRAACVEALTLVQKHHGWVNDEHLADVADLLDMTVDELDSIATFYNLIYRRPVGEHVILLCDSVSCWLTGYEEIRDALREALGIDFGETTEDGHFTLLPICCLGACDRAPVMMVDEETHRDLTADSVPAILEQYGAG